MLTDFINLILGYQHSVILRQDGSVWSTAINLHGAIIPSSTSSRYFFPVFPSGATAAAAGNAFSVVLKQDDSVWAIGRNNRGQLGDGTSVDRKDTFRNVQFIIGARAVAAGGYHSMILTEEGSVWVTGWNVYGQLGDELSRIVDTDNNFRMNNQRFHIAMHGGAKAVAAGDAHSIVLNQDGSVWAAGRNNNGQLGDGSRDDRSNFVQVVPRSAVAVAAGGYHSMVLKSDGSVWATGCNDYGQLGDGSTIDRLSYLEVVSSGVKAVAAGSRHSMMLTQNGSVWASGYNEHGQLGDGSTKSSKTFMQVIVDGAKVVAAGAFHSMVLKRDGSIWATGLNKDGQFGNGLRISKQSFVRLSPFDKGSIATRYAYESICMTPSLTLVLIYLAQSISIANRMSVRLPSSAFVSCIFQQA